MIGEHQNYTHYSWVNYEHGHCLATAYTNMHKLKFGTLQKGKEKEDGYLNNNIVTCLKPNIHVSKIVEAV